MAGKLVKWTDEQGTVHYGDKIPAEAAQREHSELNQRGMTIKHIEDAAERQRHAEQQAEQSRIAQQQMDKDKLLQSAYSSEQDIVDFRDRRLAELEAQIKSTGANHEKFKKRLEALNANVTALQGAAKPVPQSLQDEIKTAELEGGRYTTLLKSLRQEQADVSKKADLEAREYKDMQARKMAAK